MTTGVGMASHSLVAGAIGGKTFRFQRVFRRADGRAFIVPLDHSLTDGPLGPAGRTNELVGLLARHGADAVVVHKGRVGLVDPFWLARLGLIVHLSGSTSRSLDPNDKVMVASVEEAAALGADAVSIHVNVGSRTEARQLEEFGTVAARCSSLGIPLLAMMYARGEGVRDEAAPATLAHLAAVAVDLGADAVKLVWSGSVESMREVVETSPIPVVIAGGPARGDEEELLTCVRDAILCGSSGLAVGRNVFTAPDTARTIRQVARIVHPDHEPVSPQPVLAETPSLQTL